MSKMVYINDFTIIVVLAGFIIVLIILTQISNQLDKMVSLLTFLKNKIEGIDDYTKWNIDIIRKEIEEKKKNHEEIKWVDTLK